MYNYCHPGPRRVWKGGSDLQSDPPFRADPANPADPADPLQNNVRLIFAVIYKVFCTFSRPLGAKMTPDAIWIASGSQFRGLLEHILAPRSAKSDPRWAK